MVFLAKVKIEYMGATQSYSLLNGTGDYPYDCIAADRHPYPDNICYIHDGGWIGSYQLKRTGLGMYSYDGSHSKTAWRKDELR